MDWPKKGPTLKTHFYRAPFHFMHFALGDDNSYITGVIYVQNSIAMPHLAVIQLMRVFQWPRSDSEGSCMNKNVCGNKGFYSIQNFLFKNVYAFHKLSKRRVL